MRERERDRERERERERESSTCHERSGRTSPKRAGAALSLHHQGRPCGSPVLRSGALSWHLPHPLASDQGRHGGCRLGWALGPSSLASPDPSLSFISAPPKVGAPSEIRVCKAIALWTGLGPRSFLPSFLCFSLSLSIFLSLSFSLSGREGTAQILQESRIRLPNVGKKVPP